MEPKKYKKYQIERKRGLFFRIGLAISLALVIAAFELRLKKRIPADYSPPERPTDIVFMLPVSAYEDQVAARPDVEEATETAPKREEAPVEFEPILRKTAVRTAAAISTPANDSGPLIGRKAFVKAEIMPQPAGGWEAFYEYVARNLRYPRRAAQLGISGAVLVEFIVDENGNLTRFRILKGIGGGCDEEAIRVLSNAPKWSPGIQRGSPVRVRMKLPLAFRLQ